MSYGQPPASPPYGSSPYGGGYGYGGGPVEHPKGTQILIFGILGLVVCMPFGIAAWVMGNKALAEIDSSGMTYSNRGQIRAGQICGMVAVALTVIGILLYVLLFAVIFGASS